MAVIAGPFQLANHLATVAALATFPRTLHHRP